MALADKLSQLFHDASRLLEVKGENRFKVIAFQKIGRVLEDPALDLERHVREGTVEDIDGVGATAAKIIREYATTGRSTDLDELRQSVPPELPALLNVNGLGPKTVGLLWHELGVDSPAALKRALDEGKLAGLKGIGEKKIEQITQGLELLATAGQRRGLRQALHATQPLLDWLKSDARVASADVAGSLRRGRETVGDVDILCACRKLDDAPAVCADFAKQPGVERVLAEGDTKASVLVAGGLQVDLRVVPVANFGAALQYFTGSKDHNKHVRNVAIARKLTLNEWGLYRASEYDVADKPAGKPPLVKPVAAASEIEVYAALGLQLIPPELREDRGEIELAAKNALPALLTAADLLGDLHTHTTASDGVDTIEAMAEAAKVLGYKYLAITDHSKSQPVANGLDAKRLLKHIKAVHAANDRVKGIELLAGSEVDILVDGRLDYEDAILAELDWVAASPHVSLRQDEAKATARLLRAIENPYVNVVGHPTGRLINSRAGLPLDMAQIVKAAAASGTALEINASWPRLDLNDAHARQALLAGCTLTIDTDAHSTGGLAERDLGVLVARRAWAEARHVLNCQPLARVKAWVKAKRPR